MNVYKLLALLDQVDLENIPRNLNALTIPEN